MSRKKIQIMLALVVFAVLAVVTIKFIGYRQMFGGQDAPVISTEGDGNIAIGKVDQTATRDGLKQWRLEAVRATYDQGQNKAFLEDLTVTYFLEDGKQIRLTADQGTLNKKTNDMEVSGNVLIIDERFRLEARRIRYDHKKRLIHADLPVELTSEAWDLEADSMSMDLKTRKTRFEGNVNGIFNKSLSF